MGTLLTPELCLAAVLFIAGLAALFALRHTNKRNVRVRDNNGVIITGDDNQNISIQIAQQQAHATATPWWRKVAASLAWLATLAGPVIAYWALRGGR